MTSMKRWARRLNTLRGVAPDDPSRGPRNALRALLPVEHHDRLEVIWERLQLCVHPAFYAAQLTSQERAAHGGMCDPEVALAHYLDRGALQGLRICALFHPQWYADRLAERGEAVPAGMVPFLHWLAVGWERRIVPTPLFDEEFYREHNRHTDGVGHWLFRHYLATGCYLARTIPVPTGRLHPLQPDPSARERRWPLLLTEALFRADEFDLSRTSWLEEGVIEALSRYRAFLDSPRVQELLAKATALEPLVARPEVRSRGVSVAPYRQHHAYLSQQAERLRLAVTTLLGATTVDTLVLVPGSDPGVSRHLVRGLRHAEPDRSVLVVLTGGTGAPEEAADEPDGMPVLDLGPFHTGLTDNLTAELVVTLVRGLQATRVAFLGGEIGWHTITTYGRQLGAEASLGAALGPATDPDEVRRFETCFQRLDWLLVEDAEDRDLLAERYVLPESRRRRLVLRGELAADPARVAALITDQPRSH